MNGREVQRRFFGTAGLVFVLYGAAGLGAGGTAFAQDGSKEPIELGEILVTPRRHPGLSVEVSDYPANATVVTAKDIRASGARTLPELLGRYAGVQVADSSGFGLGSGGGGTITLRGIGTADQSRTSALVLLNGVRLNRLTDDGILWQSIPLGEVERVEIIRGGASAVYGEGALSGVINIVTKGPGDKPFSGEAGLELGNYGQFKHTYVARSKTGPLGLSVHWDREFIDGYRDSSSSRQTTFLHTAELAPDPGTRVQFRYLFHRDTTRFPGGITQQVAQDNRKSAGAFTGFFDTERHILSWTFFKELMWGWSLVFEPHLQKLTSDSTAAARFVTKEWEKGMGVRLGHQGTLGPAGSSLVAGVDLADEEAITGAALGGPFSKSERTQIGLYFEEALTLWERLKLYGGFRYDRLRYIEDLTSFPLFAGTLRFEGRAPKAGVSFQITPNVSVFGQYSRAFKAPSINDIDAVLPPFTDNPNVKPQKADNFEIGMKSKVWRTHLLEATLFWTKIQDEILFNRFTFANENFNTMRRGLELSARGEIGKRWDYRADYAVLHAKVKRGDFRGKDLPFTPRHQLSGTLGLRIIPALRVALDWTLVNDFFRFNDFNNSFPGDNYGVLGLAGTYDRGPWQIYARVQNLTNEEYSGLQGSTGTAVAAGENPSPPTNFVAGARIRF